jgi:hypothetical protein
MAPLVVYIIADNRSGSTLLDYLISCHPDAISVGELHHIQGYYNKTGVGIRTNWKCSCGADVQHCEFWREVLSEASFADSMETKMVAEEAKWSFLNSALHRNALNDLLSTERIDKKGRTVAENSWRLYAAINRLKNKLIIIDSSKNPIEAYYRFKYRKGNIRFLLLERNVLAVAYSNTTRTLELSDEVRSAMSIKDKPVVFNIIASFKILLRNRQIARRIQQEANEDVVKTVSYEDLANDPSGTMSDIWAFLGVSSIELPTTTNQYSSVPHILGGSPSRYSKLEIKPDNRWKDYYKSRPILYAIGKLVLRIIK